jgi:ferrochelatase
MVSAGRRKIAVILFNLGGPDQPSAVRPFLRNLFSDPAIIALPQPFRGLLAGLLSRRRAPAASAIYAKLGGKSPLLDNTQAQATALEQASWGEGDIRAFVCMRYWRPQADEVVLQVKDWAPDEILLLPLYPQFSTTTTASSVTDWHRAAAAVRLKAPTRLLCCYPVDSGFVRSTAKLLRWAVAEAAAHGTPRVLFSAHGLPEKVIARGDPYQWQCEQTALAVVEELAVPDLEWVSCYQSRATPVPWIKPFTEEEIRRAGRESRSVVVVPLAFVSEHSETLIEIGEEYRQLAADCGVPHFVRVPAVGVEPDFIQGLAALVHRMRSGEGPVCSGQGGRLCPDRFAGCPLARETAA